MTDLVVVVPSRGRPEAASAVTESFAETCTADTRLVFAVDDDDPELPEYLAVSRRTTFNTSVCIVREPRSMVHALNTAAVYITIPPDNGPFAVGFMGDDHRPRTVGWDVVYLQGLKASGTGIVYGDDLLQHRNLPTQCAMTADIVRALGFMAPPALTHMYVDNFWLALGTAAGCVRYLPDVVVEHLHPVAGKAQWDEGYVRVNDPAMYSKDGRVFAEYVRDSLAGDVEKVRALRSVHA